MLKPTSGEHVWLLCCPGDAGAVAALPIALALKTHRPDCQVTCVVRGMTPGLLKGQAAIDTVVCDPGIVSLANLFGHRTPTRVLLLALWPIGGVLALTACIAGQILNRVGGNMPARRGGLNLFPLFNRMPDPVSLSQTLRTLGLPSQLPGRPWVALTPREQRRAVRRFRRLSRPRVLVHPSAMTASPGLLLARWSLVVAGVGVKESDPGSFAQWAERGAVDLTGKLSIREWLGVLLECDVFVSADEESLFLAEAMGVPSVRVDPVSPNGGSGPVLPEAVMWQVEALLRHRIRVLARGTDRPYARIS